MGWLGALLTEPAPSGMFLVTMARAKGPAKYSTSSQELPLEVTRVTSAHASLARAGPVATSPYHMLGRELAPLGVDTNDTAASPGLGLLTRRVAGRDRLGWLRLSP